MGLSARSGCGKPFKTPMSLPTVLDAGAVDLYNGGRTRPACAGGAPGTRARRVLGPSGVAGSARLRSADLGVECALRAARPVAQRRPHPPGQKTPLLREVLNDKLIEHR
eukprot:CAMPEP_0204566044 /NCGR_PEP_ID=MMETSP0661-20131031/35829_1 /ASSEMBLY_ACC=CAM_ASM_000606 /TAXON_ID=109239 /ORGANISM="Alexandrium margalefi, Strain AMGDE01CS-322" /LENGTH=108 /DNA_ID=CAMNT_0051573859 /DNA_START=18 /DNA_END=340 /DNA_ORIENTATION=-